MKCIMKFDLLIIQLFLPSLNLPILLPWLSVQGLSMEIIIVSWLSLIVVSGKYENKYNIFFIHLYYHKHPLEFLTKKNSDLSTKDYFRNNFPWKKKILSTENFLCFKYFRGGNIWLSMHLFECIPNHY